ncbi:site-2 protease family protein [Persicobacter sp. CCB-QB2]|uniref:site-2 protease family protein n=1 Tax=Persicobacter sp. CCB-QB2 TaxID=1561025 RepID=UPI0006A9E848|nr:site-2 protease family protein [Persicobacter sp. CCB-QB2]
MQKKILIHLGLFILTLITTTLAGAEWMFGKSWFFGEEVLSKKEFFQGFWYSIPFLGILTAHEFGHYFVARKLKVNTSLPYYIPQWFFSFTMSLGTFGALIQIKDKINSRKKYFDIGLAGPLAGFIVCLFVLTYGYTHLPDPTFIYQIHPEYEQYGLDYPQHVYAYDPADENANPPIRVGGNLLMMLMEKVLVADPTKIPDPHEMIHYPLLFAGYLALFFTALNLLPIGQLDGGHILYGLIGDKAHRIVSKYLFMGLLFLGGIGLINPGDSTQEIIIYSPLYLYFLYLCFYKMTNDRQERLFYAVIIFAMQYFAKWLFPSFEGFTVWLVFMFVLGRFLGVYHPPTTDTAPLGKKRIILGWLAMVIFIISFVPQVLVFG